MTDVSVIGPDGGEVIELGPARMRIMEDGGTTTHRLGIGEITLAPHSEGPPQHRHAEHDEGFYVVFGVPMLGRRSEEHTSELQSRFDLVCRLLLEKKK